MWFGKVPGAPADVDLTLPPDGSNRYDWAIKFAPDAIKNITSLAQTADLISEGGIEFHVQRGLGMVGWIRGAVAAHRRRRIRPT